MKKIVLIIVTLCMYHAASSQITGKNELKLNLLSTAAFLYPELTYERIWGGDFGSGLSAAFSLKGNSYYVFQFTPFFRGYFGQNTHTNFFIEANVGITGIRDNDDDKQQKRSVTDFGFGLAVGWRYISNSGLVGEIYLGGGRTLDERFYPRIGVSIGKRF